MSPILFSILLLAPADADAIAAPGSGLTPPMQIVAHGVPIDIGRDGKACPLFADLDGDGLRDPLVGEAWGGRLRVYHNLGTQQSPKFGDYEWLRAGDGVARVPRTPDDNKGFTPQLVDLDGDGRLDIVSRGSVRPTILTNEFHWFRRIDEQTFAAPVKLCGEDGEPIQLTGLAHPACADWNGDGMIDLVIGTLEGAILMLKNVGSPAEPRFAAPIAMTWGGVPIIAGSKQAHPCVADWDSDGDLDLLVAALDGRVVWYQNHGTATEPRLKGFIVLVRPSTVQAQMDDQRPKGHPGMQPAVDVADYNGDGRADLLLGDRCGRFRGAAPQLPHEQRRFEQDRQRLARLRSEWAELFRAYQAKTVAAASPAATVDSRTIAELRSAMEDLNARIAEGQADVEYYRPGPGYQMHGFVWVFLRKPADN